MRIEIRGSGDEARCPHCGAGALLFLPSNNANFEKDFDARIDLALGRVRWWQLGRKKGIAAVKELKDQLTHELREATRQL